MQLYSPVRGWEDTQWASLQRQPCILAAEHAAVTRRVPARVVRKPHGWQPSVPQPVEPEPVDVLAQEPEQEQDLPAHFELDDRARRAHEKKLRNRVAQEARRPTVYTKLLDKSFLDL